MKVSVIIPVYNTEDYLAKCLNSILTQTMTDLEIICIDDGSTDASTRIMSEFAEKDSRVSVLRQENSGQSAARNRGIDAASGEYICFVDSDDWLDAEALEKLCPPADRENLDVLYFGGKVSFDTENLLKEHEEYFDRAYKRTDNGNKILNGKDMIVCQRSNRQFWKVPYMALIRRSYLLEKQIRFKEGMIHEDNLFAYQLCINAERTMLIPDAYYNRLVREDSVITAVKTHRNLYGYVSTVIEETRCMEGLDRVEKEITSLVISDALASLYKVWEALTPEEKEKANDILSGEQITVSEDSLYRGMILPWLREKDRLVQRERELRRNISELRQRTRELEAENTLHIQETELVYQSRPYRLGHFLLAPMIKTRNLIQKRKKAD